MSGATVRVRGEAVVPAKADEVELWIEVAALEQSPDAAFDAVSERSASLERLLDEVGVPPEHRVTTGVTIGPHREYEHAKVVARGYRASNQTRVRLPSAEPVGRLIREATRRAHARVQGPWWRIAPENPARLEACRVAAADARRKAEAYADALGLRLGAVSDVREPLVEGMPLGNGMRMAVAYAASEPDSELRVQAGELDVAAYVDVTFVLEERR